MADELLMSGFDRVSQKLDAMRQVSYSQATRLLGVARVTTTSAALLHEYAPQRLAGLGRVSLLDRPNNDLHPLDNAALEVLAKMFPCNADLIWEDIINAEELPGILIEPVFNLSSDEFNECVDSPENFGDAPMTSLMIFTYYLGQCVDSPYFERAAEHFGWSLENTPVCVSTANAIDYVDLERFYKLLDENSLAEFELPWRIHEHENSNIFLDWTLDDVYNGFMPYTMETIHELVDAWAVAEPRIAELRAAADRFVKERWIASRLADLWDQCVQYKDGRMPRTLLELWGGHPVVDEFYGPIGLSDDEEDDD